MATRKSVVCQLFLRLLFLLTIIQVALTPAGKLAAAVPRYELTILSGLGPDPAVSLPQSINTPGQIAGVSDFYLNSEYLGVRAAKWSTPTSVASLGVLAAHPDGHSLSFANDINSSGLVVGSTTDHSQILSPFGSSAAYWLPGDMLPNRLPEVTGYGGIAYAGANAINDLGNIVGSAQPGSDRRVALRWESPSSAPTALADAEVDGKLLAAVAASDINDSGWIVGHGQILFDTRAERPMAWDASGTSHALPMPLNVEPSQEFASATAINEMGEIIGSGIAPKSDGAEIELVGLRWPSVGHTPQVLEFFDLPSDSVGNSAYSINRSGLIVGEARIVENGNIVDARGLVWDQQNLVYELNSLVNDLRGWNLISANSVNDQGWIVGVGRNSEGFQAGFLLIPVPEPGAAAILWWLLIAASTTCRGFISRVLN